MGGRTTTKVFNTFLLPPPPTGDHMEGPIMRRLKMNGCDRLVTDKTVVKNE